MNTVAALVIVLISAITGWQAKGLWDEFRSCKYCERQALNWRSKERLCAAHEDLYLKMQKEAGDGSS